MNEVKTAVLVVDDEEGIRRVVRRVLEGTGMNVETAESGAEALQALQRGNRFDAIVTDLLMPGVHGVEFLRRVREVDLDVPVVVLTGNPTLESAIAVIQYGAFRYLQKPFEAAQLTATVRDAVSLHRLATLKRRALELLESGAWLIGDNAGLDARFDRALDELWIAFQPIVAWPDQTVHGYEALVRSTEPTLSTPELLFEAAERLGRVQELGRAIRTEIAVCATSAPEDSSLFVNVHARDLSDESLYARSAPLSCHAGRTVLEITERASLQGVPNVREKIGALRDLGFRIAVDDLGAGYAGLTSFSQLEPDVAKLDMSLIRGVDESTPKASIVRSMISVCRDDLDTRVVCEGVETPAERDALQALGADLLQGYLFAAPEPQFRRSGIFADAVD